MFYDKIDFPNLPLADWRKFRKEASPYLFEKVIDRDEACLPPSFVPLARGVAIASDYLLRRLGCHGEMPRPTGWREPGHGYFRNSIDRKIFLGVWNCEKTGLWTVERLTKHQRLPKIDEVLVYPFGRTPVFARTCSEAMQLAMHCHVNGPPAELCWLKVDPTKNISAIEIADRRRIEEAHFNQCRSGLIAA